MIKLPQQLIEQIIVELRGEYGIPLYCSNDALANYINEGNHEFITKYVSNINYDIDLTARGLLKNYVNYAYFHVTNEFYDNYANSLVSWQISKIGNTNEEDSSVQ